MTSPTLHSAPWYAEVTRAQWLVLAIASAGWVFDTFEGQIFNITSGQMLPELLGINASSSSAPANPAAIELTDLWRDRFLAVFLVGGTLGGIIFGILADRFGRKPMMIVTILCYSVFSGLSYFATDLWHVAALRFLVALGVGGEWAVAATLVSEVFPTRARAHASGIFHATSVLGTWLAALAGLVVQSQWRYAYLVGVIPALLVLWVRAGIDEPDRRSCPGSIPGVPRGRLRELFRNPIWARRAILGILLASVGLGTFWGVTIAGQKLAEEILKRTGATEESASQQAKFAYGIVETAGGGLGLLCFGPLAERLGRRSAFTLMHVLACIIVPVTCYLPATYNQLLCLLPFYGFCTLGIHAGYAVYFPELFPDALRATGTGLCFNGGRLIAALVLIFSAQLKALPGMDLRLAITILSSLFLAGVVIVRLLPETRGEELPEA
jgi:MFS family permease